MGWQEAGTSPGYQNRVTACICTDITMSSRSRVGDTGHSLPGSDCPVIYAHLPYLG